MAYCVNVVHTLEHSKVYWRNPRESAFTAETRTSAHLAFFFNQNSVPEIRVSAAFGEFLKFKDQTRRNPERNVSFYEVHSSK